MSYKYSALLKTILGMIPWIFPDTMLSCIHAVSHSFISVFQQGFWGTHEALHHTLVLETAPVLHHSWVFGGVNHTADLSAAILLLVHCNNYSVFINPAPCPDFLLYSKGCLNAGAERRGQGCNISYQCLRHGQVGQSLLGCIQHVLHGALWIQHVFPRMEPWQNSMHRSRTQARVFVWVATWHAERAGCKRCMVHPCMHICETVDLFRFLGNNIIYLLKEISWLQNTKAKMLRCI